MRSVLALSCLMSATPMAYAGVPAEDLVGANPVTKEWTDQRARPRGPSEFRASMIEAHNALRGRFGVDALVWDERLAADATAYARTLSTTQRFRHAVQDDSDAVQGENLWMGTRTAYAYADMTGAWVEEGKNFRAGVFPEVSRTGSLSDVGHFTQMIWAGTRAVGCGISENAEDEVLVCRYFPAGNVMGESPLPRYRTAATSLANASAR